jgi:hypothetical protein
MKNLAFGSSGDRGKTKTADLTPTSTVTVEVISANAAEMLKNFNENMNIDAAVAEVQDGVNDYYADDSNSDALAALLTAADEGNAISLNNLSNVENAAIKIYTLTVGVNPANSGTVSPNGVISYLKNAKVKLQAFNNEKGSFFEWSGGLRSVNNPSDEMIMDGDKTVTANFARRDGIWPVDEIADTGSWDWDDTWQIGEFGGNYNKRPDTGISGAIIHGLKVGKKDGKLHLMAKLSNDAIPNRTLMYQFIIVTDANNNGNYLDEKMIFVNVTWNDKWNAQSALQLENEGLKFTTTNAAVFAHSIPDGPDDEGSDLFAVSIPISMIEEILGEKDYYAVSIDTFPIETNFNYYVLDFRKVVF